MRDVVRVRTLTAFVALSFCLIAEVPAAAQGTPPAFVGLREFPTVDFGRLSPGDPVPGQPGKVFQHVLLPAGGGGWVIAEARPTTADEPSEADCYPTPNPYAIAPGERDRAARCAEWQRRQIPTPPLPTFTVGATYVHPYPHIRMVVLAVTRSLDGVPVVTAQYTAGEQLGEVFAFRVDRGEPWQEVR